MVCLRTLVYEAYRARTHPMTTSWPCTRIPGRAVLALLCVALRQVRICLRRHCSTSQMFAGKPFAPDHQRSGERPGADGIVFPPTGRDEVVQHFAGSGFCLLPSLSWHQYRKERRPQSGPPWLKGGTLPAHTESTLPGVVVGAGDTWEAEIFTSSSDQSIIGCQQLQRPDLRSVGFD